MNQSHCEHTWTLADAKARYSEIRRLAEEGPQRIRKRRSFVIVSAEVWDAQTPPGKRQPRMPLGQWLVENLPRGIDLELPSRDEPEGEIPFVIAEEE